MMVGRFTFARCAVEFHPMHSPCWQSRRHWLPLRLRGGLGWGSPQGILLLPAWLYILRRLSCNPALLMDWSANRFPGRQIKRRKSNMHYFGSTSLFCVNRITEALLVDVQCSEGITAANPGLRRRVIPNQPPPKVHFNAIRLVRLASQAFAPNPHILTV